MHGTQPSLSPMGTQLWSAARKIAQLEYEVKRLEDQRDALVEIIKQVLNGVESSYKQKLSNHDDPSTDAMNGEDTIAALWWNKDNGIHEKHMTGL